MTTGGGDTPISDEARRQHKTKEDLAGLSKSPLIDLQMLLCPFACSSVSAPLHNVHDNDGQGLLLGRLVFDLDDLPSPVETTVRADAVRQNRLMAVVALTQRWHANGIVGAATISSTFAQFSLW